MALRKPDVIDTAEATKVLVEQPAAVVKETVAANATESGGTVVVDGTDANGKDANVKDDDGKDASVVVDSAAVELVQSDEPQLEPEVEPEVVIVAEQKKVVVQPAANSAVVVPHKANNAMANFTQEMADEGFEGLNLTGQSFDRVKLDEAMFQLGSEDLNLGPVINVQIMNTRPIYIVRQFKGEGSEIFYSYDPKGLTKSDGTSAEETLAEWREDGYGEGEGNTPLEIKKYIEAMAMLVDRDDEHEGLIVSLSIPPTSTDRLAGAFAVGKQLYQAAPSNLIIQCKVGNKIAAKGGEFRPWIFKALRKAS